MDIDVDISSFSDVQLRDLWIKVATERRYRVRGTDSIAMPPPDQHLLNFSTTDNKVAYSEYAARNNCSIVVAKSVFDMYKESHD